MDTTRYTRAVISNTRKGSSTSGRNIVRSSGEPPSSIAPARIPAFAATTSSRRAALHRPRAFSTHTKANPTTLTRSPRTTIPVALARSIGTLVRSRTTPSSASAFETCVCLASRSVILGVTPSARRRLRRDGISRHCTAGQSPSVPTYFCTLRSCSATVFANAWLREPFEVATKKK